jgi:PAS domain S-box-containing protein
MNGLFDLSRFTPHGFCLAWDPGLIWLLAGSDTLIALAYFSIPAALVVFLRHRRDLAFKPVFALFAAFILACGATHVMGAVTLWVPAYRLEGFVNAITAVLSVSTATMLWPLLPGALTLPSPEALRRVNAALAFEVVRRDEVACRLRESEERQRRIYARTPAALHAIDDEGRLIDVSDRWLELTGYTRDEVIGQSIFQFFSPATREIGWRNFFKLKQGLGDPVGERQFLCRDGTVRDIEVKFEPERDSSGKLLRIMAAITDVTARKEAEAALHVAEERLRQAQKMEAVGQLTGGIAHDFNNLLTTIMGSLELLQQRASLDERSVRLAANALEGSRRAARLTSQLLSFSRRQRLAPEALRPCEVIEGIHDLLARTLGDGTTLAVSLPDETWMLLADRNQLEAALLNLVINARDAVRGGGNVRIEICNISVGGAAEGIEDGLPPGDYVAVCVCDDGVGMTEEVRARAFEPFFTTKGPGAGTGLGLSQTYGFVTQSGGTIRIDSATGRGTRIEMLLPRAEGPDAAADAANNAGQARGGKGEHILLVEDDALVRQTMAEALRGRGYMVTEASDAAEAIHLLDGAAPPSPFSLLFTDVVMPGGLTGVDLALRARRSHATLPVLFATGYSSAAVLDAWPEPVDVLPKPYSPEQVAARIAAKLDMKEMV